jgi:hypothetical protein
MVMLTRVLTVKPVDPVIPDTVAEIVVTPLDTLWAMPAVLAALLIVATAWADEFHVTCGVRF